MIARVLVFGVFFGVFAVGCKLLSIGYTILDDFAAQNFDIVDEAYGFFAVFVVSGFFFFWGFIASTNGIFIPFCKNYFKLNQFQSRSHELKAKPDWAPCASPASAAAPWSRRSTAAGPQVFFHATEVLEILTQRISGPPSPLV